MGQNQDGRAERLTISVPARGELEGEEARGIGNLAAGWGIEAFWHCMAIFETYVFFIHSVCRTLPFISLHFATPHQQ